MCYPLPIVTSNGGCAANTCTYLLLTCLEVGPDWGNTLRLSLQATEYKNVGDFGREYTTLFKAASLIIDTIPKHKDFQLPRYQKQYKSAQDYLRKTVMPRLEKIKAGKMAQAVHAPVRAHAVKVDTGNMPSVNWQQYQPAASVGQQHVPANYFVRNPTVDSTIDRRSHQPPPVTVDPADPFSASVAFSSSAAPPPTVSLLPATVAGASHN